jgi:hypothetical protein
MHGTDPVLSGHMLDSDIGKSRLCQQLLVLSGTQERGADERHDDAIDQPQRPSAVGFGDQGERPSGVENSQDFPHGSPPGRASSSASRQP